MKIARAAVDIAKVALGGRGPPWWTDEAPGFNRRMAKDTIYAEWYTVDDIPNHGMIPVC